MPIPKVGDVIELRGQPWVGNDWAKLQTERFWIVTGLRRHSLTDYCRLYLRGLHTGYVPIRESPYTDWPLEEKEIVINEFLSAANQAILNTKKENQPDEPASK